ncbi:MAG TPA: hypothetical protein VMB21_00145 [Candidatus Limnocylindria bacterium]|nr:hypothetical protein [Candidatus Limnocylindria bacterium]
MKPFSKRGSGLLAVGGVVFAVVLVLALIWLRSGERLPQANGYDDFVKAGRALSGRASDVDSKDAAQVAAFAAKNSTLPIQIRNGLAKECRVPVEFKAAWFTSHMGDMMALKQAGYALELLAKEREAAGAFDEAITLRLDAVRMGIESYRGGLLIDYLIGTAVEIWSLKNLTQMASRLDAVQCRRVLKIAAESDQTRETLDSITRRDREWSWLGSGWWESWDGIKEMAGDIFKQPSGDLLGRQRELKAARGKLNLALARRAFELEQGRAPANDAELIPKYLLSLP